MRIRRRGILLMEVFIACGLLAVVVAVTVEMLSMTATARRAGDRREMALQEAANAVERAAAIPFAELSDERLSQIKLSPAVAALLPGAKLKLVSEPGDELADNALPAHHVTVEVSWTSATGGNESPVRLDFWTFAAPAPISAGGAP